MQSALPPSRGSVGQPVSQPRPETVRRYAADWAHFVGWCRVARRAALPAGSDTLADYLRAIAPGLSRGTIGRRRAAVRAMHRQHGLALPELDAATRAALRRAARPPPPKRAEGLPAGAADRRLWVRLALTCPRDRAGVRDRALLLLAAGSGLLQDELLGLQCEQLRFAEAGLSVALPSRPVVSLARAGTLASCPVRALEDWLRTSDTRFGPVFRKVDRWGNVEHARLGADGLRRIVARRLAARAARAVRTG